MEIIISTSVIFTSLTVRGQPSPGFHVEAWLAFRNCEMDYSFFETPVILMNFELTPENIVWKIEV